MTSEECRAFVIKKIENQSLGELSQNIAVSKTALSLYGNGKYKHNAGTIEKKIAAFINRANISFRDERRLVDILAILDEADNPQSIIAAIAGRY